MTQQVFQECVCLLLRSRQLEVKDKRSLCRRPVGGFPGHEKRMDWEEADSLAAASPFSCRCGRRAVPQHSSGPATSLCAPHDGSSRTGAGPEPRKRWGRTAGTQSGSPAGEIFPIWMNTLFIQIRRRFPTRTKI